MLRVSAGREDEFARMREWLSGSAMVDAVIESTEDRPLREGPRIVRPLPAALVAAYRKEQRPEVTAGRRWGVARART